MSTNPNDKTITAGAVPSRLSVRDIALIGQCAALMAICSWISIPASVPFTMQTFGVFLTIGLLGGKRGTLAVLVFLLMGAVGLPVFSGFTGGIGHMVGVTGGYITGFLFSALLMWLIESLAGRSIQVLTVSMAAGLLVCYAFGTAWFMAVYAKQSGPIGLSAALGMCILPYIIPDICKIILASLLTKRLRPHIR